MIWRCPRCRSELSDNVDSYACAPCAARYEILEGIPDFRLSGSVWVDFDEDINQARKLVQAVPPEDVEGSVRWIFAARQHGGRELAERRTRQVMEAPARLKGEFGTWLAPLTDGRDGFIDLGCGGGMLLTAAAGLGTNGIGIDVSMVWLVVAKRMISAAGGHPILAAAESEALPLADASVPGVALLDVIEHVGDQAKTLAEINRVMAPGGFLAMATPNRFSLTAEPHVQVWGVGWVPRRWQKGYVRWRSGKPYEFVRLLSSREMARLIRRHMKLDFKLVLPPVSPFEITHFGPAKAALAKLYNRMLSWRWTHWALLKICPFFRVKGYREGGADGRAEPGACVE